MTLDDVYIFVGEQLFTRDIRATDVSIRWLTTSEDVEQFLVRREALLEGVETIIAVSHPDLLICQFIGVQPASGVYETPDTASSAGFGRTVIYGVNIEGNTDPLAFKRICQVLEEYYPASYKSYTQSGRYL